jgi:hypothetical protein
MGLNCDLVTSSYGLLGSLTLLLQLLLRQGSHRQARGMEPIEILYKADKDPDKDPKSSHLMVA